MVPSGTQGNSLRISTLPYMTYPPIGSDYASTLIRTKVHAQHTLDISSPSFFFPGDKLDLAV